MQKILLVDDEEDVEFLAKQKFRKQISEGTFAFLFSQNGQDALELIQSDPSISVVILDLNMPGMDGFTLLDRLKDFNPAIKAIVVSAYSDIKTFRTAMNKGAFDFVTKPVDFNDLGDTILHALELYRSQQPTPLYSYQEILRESFPKEINLIPSPQEKSLLWDVFFLKPLQMGIIGVTPPSSPYSDIVRGVTHGILKTLLREEQEFSFSKIEEHLNIIFPFLRPNIFIGQYNREKLEFFYETNSGFNVRYLEDEKATPLPPSQTVRLALGKRIIIQHPLSSSQLSLSNL